MAGACCRCSFFGLVVVLALLLLLGSGFAAADNASSHQNSSGLVKVEMAKGFNIYYGNYYKVALNYFSNSSFLIVQNDTKLAHLHQCGQKLKSVVAPLANYTIDTINVPVSFLELLGMMEPLQGVTSRFVSSPCLAQYIDNGDVKEINQTDPQVMQHFSAHLTSEGSDSTSQEPCNFVTVDPFQEQNPLQRAEWIKYVSLFMNYEERANDIFEKVRSNYQCLTSAVSSAVATNASDKPTVAWLSFCEGVWAFSAEPYKLQYVIDAGGSNLDDSAYSNSYNMSSASDVESFHEMLSGIDIIIDETYASPPSEYALQTFTENAQISEYDSFPFMNKQSVWRYDKQDQGSYVPDWLDRGLAQPHVAIADLIHAFHHLQPNYTTAFLRNIAEGEAALNSSSMECTHDKLTPLELTMVPCNCDG